MQLERPFTNRVTPLGEFCATAARGRFMGNRGILHDADGRFGAARWRHKAWIICKTEFKGRKREILAPNRYTELFFLDEATALAAGHRPCFECRREAARDFMKRARIGLGLAPDALASAGQLDRLLHAERVDRRTRLTAVWTAPFKDLPDGAMILDPETARPALVAASHLRLWSFEGYSSSTAIEPERIVEVLTPRTSVAAIRSGYAVTIAPYRE